MDMVGIPFGASRKLGITSAWGRVELSAIDLNKGRWGYNQNGVVTSKLNRPPANLQSFLVINLRNGWMAAFPYWQPLLGSLAAAYCASMPWIRFRFSLRTLLIASTLLAAILGLAAWAVR